ncbi:MAG: hypothetical protein OXN95_04805 [bacterium]|nr:hypothetical protein [bacterium]
MSQPLGSRHFYCATILGTVDPALGDGRGPSGKGLGYGLPDVGQLGTDAAISGDEVAIE